MSVLECIARSKNVRKIFAQRVFQRYPSAPHSPSASSIAPSSPGASTLQLHSLSAQRVFEGNLFIQVLHVHQSRGDVLRVLQRSRYNANTMSSKEHYMRFSIGTPVAFSEINATKLLISSEYSSPALRYSNPCSKCTGYKFKVIFKVQKN